MNDKKTLMTFSFSALLIFMAMIVGAAWKQGWFLPRENFSIRFPSANGLFVGTPVLLTGLKVGEVKDVDLDEEGRVEVLVSVLSRYASQLREDASATSERTFVIGEKIISLSAGSRDRPVLAPGSELLGHEAMELTDILSARHMGRYFETFELLMEQLSALVGAAGSDEANLASLYKQLHKSLKGIEHLSQDMRILRTDVLGTQETRLLLSNLSKASRDMEVVMAELRTALPRLNSMSGEFQHMMPNVAKALQESVVTLQAMQRTFFLRSGVKEVLEEQPELRVPASNPTQR
jgi:phospholipid/cholesterol/gamma-HCH transport system substrate-binding protein